MKKEVDRASQLDHRGGSLPLADASFDAIFCNDSINRVPERGRRCGTGAASSKCNERLLTESGVVVREVRDATEAVASIAGKWRDARERRLSRYVYLASKASGPGA